MFKIKYQDFINFKVSRDAVVRIAARMETEILFLKQALAFAKSVSKKD